MLDEQVRIVKEMSKMAKETWNITQQQFNLGRVRANAVHSAEAAYLSTLTQINDFERQIRATGTPSRCSSDSPVSRSPVPHWQPSRCPTSLP